MPRKQIRRIVVLMVGWALIALGVVGLFLPVLQGVLFILLGLYVLSRESKTARRWLDRLRARHPAVDERLHRWRARVDRWATKFRRSGSKGGPGGSVDSTTDREMEAE